MRPQALQIFIKRDMSEVQYELVSSTNYSDSITQNFHKPTRSIIGWQSTDFGVPPIDILFKLQTLTFVTQLYLSPKKNKHIRSLEVLVSQDNQQFTPLAKIYDLNDAVRVEVSGKCRYIKMVVLEKQNGRPASIELLRIYGHPYFKYHQDQLFHTQKTEKVQQILMGYGFNQQRKWQVDDQTLITLHDMSKIQSQCTTRGEKQRLAVINKDLKKVLQLGQKIKLLQTELKYINARSQFEKVKECKDQILALCQQRDKYDQKYQTSRFEDMIAMENYDNKHDELLKNLLIDDKHKLQEERRRREEEARERERQLNEEFDKMQQEEEQWWAQKNQLDQIQQQKIEEKKPVVQPKKKTIQKEEDYKFTNPYVYNQGDADMQKYILPLLKEFGGQSTADPQLLRKYEQLQYLDVLGARIWISAHSENWRLRAAAVEAVLKFSQDKLPQRYDEGKTRNLFRAMMQFARINAEDKVLQIYYTSLKIMTKALQPPICGEDVPPALINKQIQKFMAILIDKISQMNARAKQISLKQLITVFKHPAVDLHIAINQTLRICKEQLNIKFIPVDKQNPRIILSRLEIIGKLMSEFNFEKRKIDYNQILSKLVEGALYHSNNEVRILAVKILQQIYKVYQQGTIDWYRSIKGLRPNIAAELEEKLNIN